MFVLNEENTLSLRCQSVIATVELHKLCK